MDRTITQSPADFLGSRVLEPLTGMPGLTSLAKEFPNAVPGKKPTRIAAMAPALFVVTHGTCTVRVYGAHEFPPHVVPAPFTSEVGMLRWVVENGVETPCVIGVIGNSYADDAAALAWTTHPGVIRVSGKGAHTVDMRRVRALRDVLASDVPPAVVGRLRVLRDTLRVDHSDTRTADAIAATLEEHPVLATLPDGITGHESSLARHLSTVPPTSAQEARAA